MNESILAYRAWTAVNRYLYFITWDYFDKEGDGGWGDNYMREISDDVCGRWDETIEVLEWLEKKFE